MNAARYVASLPGAIFVMAGLVPAIHVFLAAMLLRWMPGSSQVKPGHDEFTTGWGDY